VLSAFGRIISAPIVVAVVAGCASSPPARSEPARAPEPATCGNEVLHEEFERELAKAQAEPEPQKRVDAVCKVARDWGIEDCTNVTPKSLPLP